MKLPQIRFTVRTLLIAVAVLACALGVLTGLWRRSAEYRRQANFHQWATAVLSEAGGSGCMDDGSHDEWYDPALRKAFLYHRSLGRVYSRAARHPWHTVRSAPDPAWAYPPVLVEARDGQAVPE